jgi:hypothetical protein
MNLMLSTHFAISEFFTSPDPEKEKMYKDFLNLTGEKIARQNIDNRIPLVLEHIREKLGNKAIHINSGWRFMDNIKRPFASQHPLGRAVDFTIEGYDPKEVRLWIVSQWADDKKLQIIRGIEDTEDMNWVHIDCRNSNRLYWFSPSGKSVSNDFYAALIKCKLINKS